MLASSESETQKSSILVAVRVRPFTAEEQTHLIDSSGTEANTSYCFGDSNLKIPGAHVPTSTPTRGRTGRYMPQGLRKIVDCVDDKMLIFDPAETNPLNKISETVLNTMLVGSRGEVRRRMRRNGEQKFMFDKLFDVDASQQDVFQCTTMPLLDSILDGFNGTVFAYGATGCGKTFTISGTPDSPGIIFLTMQELFQRINNLKDTKTFELTVSYLEIYNETIRDLLEPDTPSQKLIIREDSDSTTTVANLSYHTPETVEDVMDLVIRGNVNRTTSPTDANETSSRSHAVLQVHVVQSSRTVDLKEDKMYATLSIIDLAGSERASATKNRGERLHEGSNINKSLLALGNCINALCMTGRRAVCHVPYRDSKLTRLLKFSLGGNCKTVMIVCVSPSSAHYDETLNTLKYANRAKDIKTKVIRNQHSLDRHVGSYLKMITAQKQEIEELRSREAKVIDLRLQQFRLSRNKLQMAMWEGVNQLKSNYQVLDRFQRTKTMKSLMLCKRHFLQLVQTEVNHLLQLTESTKVDHPLSGFCQTINEQLLTKICELEDSFDAEDEFQLTLEHAKEADMARFQQMETWDEATDALWYEQQLEHLAESIKNEIMVNASAMMDKMLHDTKLRSRFSFVTESLFHLLFEGGEYNAQPADSEAALDKVRDSIIDLVQIDEEFEQFAHQMGPLNDDANKRKQTSDLHRQPVKMRSPGSTAVSARERMETVSSPSPAHRSERKPAVHLRKLRLMTDNPDLPLLMHGDPPVPTPAPELAHVTDVDDSMSVSHARSNLARVNINEEDISMAESEEIPINRDINKPKLSLTSTSLRTK
ncbi:AER441Cp [Eremothecium gossypii ATCC 10895]|uniref:Kinesin-like protein n=1 Tax=Eremothecium gossypii (strain ATCC 10895 / CBS 109.51 / FGSC 9923 / NRRL Y-1056) TaxID=284811 RepID=Q755S7_EREGS|nr:AER441Cp [Eremothecium gossypii ATCC 10895]AAS53120.1 AER441Cp [Eremothecium gossypii ATCC 10895]AEY97429.1 FAER441Cp [Eremothecium gossypii FDAG1]